MDAGIAADARAAFEHLLDTGVAAWQPGVADHDEVGPRLELRGIETLEELDVGAGELVAHGRIERLIGAADGEA